MSGVPAPGEKLVYRERAGFNNAVGDVWLIRNKRGGAFFARVESNAPSRRAGCNLVRLVVLADGQ